MSRNIRSDHIAKAYLSRSRDQPLARISTPLSSLNMPTNNIGFSPDGGPRHENKQRFSSTAVAQKHPHAFDNTRVGPNSPSRESLHLLRNRIIAVTVMILLMVFCVVGVFA